MLILHSTTVSYFFRIATKNVYQAYLAELFKYLKRYNVNENLYFIIKTVANIIQ